MRLLAFSAYHVPERTDNTQKNVSQMGCIVPYRLSCKPSPQRSAAFTARVIARGHIHCHL
jgi:hypothetical protein